MTATLYFRLPSQPTQEALFKLRAEAALRALHDKDQRCVAAVAALLPFNVGSTFTWKNCTWHVTAIAGTSSHSVVFRASAIFNGCFSKMAIKCCLPPCERKDTCRLYDEWRILYYLRHRAHIVPTYGVLSLQHVFMDAKEDAHMLFLNDAGPSLTRHLLQTAQGRGLGICETQMLGRQLLSALRSLKEKKLVHGDLAAKNIGWDGRYATLFDFEHACLITTLKQYPLLALQTPYYRAPEIALNRARTTTPDYALDIWSLGCVLMEALTGKCLMQIDQIPLDMQQWMKEKMAQYDGVAAEKRHFKDALELLYCYNQLAPFVLDDIGDKAAALSSTNAELYNSCAAYIHHYVATHHKNPSLKAQLPTDQEHLQNRDKLLFHGLQRANALFLDLITKMLTFNPKERITVEDAQCHPFFHTLLTAVWC